VGADKIEHGIAPRRRLLRKEDLVRAQVTCLYQLLFVAFDCEYPRVGQKLQILHRKLAKSAHANDSGTASSAKPRADASDGSERRDAGIGEGCGSHRVQSLQREEVAARRTKNPFRIT